MTRGGSTVAALVLIVLLAHIARDLEAARAQDGDDAPPDAPAQEVG